MRPDSKEKSPPIVIKVHKKKDDTVTCVQPGTGTKTADTSGTKSVNTKKTVTLGAKSEDPLGTKKTVTEDRHKSWPEDFTPQPHYYRSRNSSTGFKGVSFINRNETGRTAQYRVKVGNTTVHRTSDLHDACEVFYMQKKKLKQNKKKKAPQSPLDDLKFI